MSEGDVSLIRDEDVLRRLWQQTEDFSRKKEIRAHMYRLREERLRNLYSPEPTADGTKGCEFTSPQGHVQSFADQTFQSMKSKEVRDAGSPPKEFTYSGQELKDLSNAGWNVESEDKTTDDGHTHVKSVNANIEGRYDVEGGKGQFAAVDQHTQAVTEYQDENSSLKRNESTSKTAAHEQVVRKTDDGSRFSSTTSSSSTSKYHQVSTKNETVPYTDDYEQRTTDTNRNEQLTRDNYEQTLRRNDDHGELMSRKVEYPDDNTRVIVETRRMPDGTRVTSTRREFRVPVQSTRSEHHSQSRSENKYSTSHKTNQTATSKTIRHTDNTIKDIVDSQRNVDNYDFKKHVIDDDFSETQSVRNYETNFTRKVIDSTNDDNYSTNSRQETSRVSKTIIDNSNIDDYYSVNQYENINRNDINRNQSENVDFQTTRNKTNRQVTDRSKSNDDYSQSVRYVTKTNRITDDNVDDRRPTKRPEGVDDIDQREYVRDNKSVHRKDVKDTINSEDKTHTVTKDTKEKIIDRKTTTDQYQTTYQTDYAQKKISSDWSPSHQAWASTLRSDTPSTTRPSTRASSPGSRTFKSSTSSLRSSVSPDKTFRKPSSRSASPSKVDRFSPSRIVTDRYSSTHSSHSVTEIKSTKHAGSDGRPPTGRSPTRPGYSPDRKVQDRQRTSVSPDKRSHEHTQRPSASPERKPVHKPTGTHSGSPIQSSEVPTEVRQSPDRKPGYQPTSAKPDDSIYPRTKSPQKIVSDKQPSVRPKDSPRASPSPDRKHGYQPTNAKPDDSIYPRTKSPQKIVSDKQPSVRPKDSPRASPSPDRQHGYQAPSAKPDDSIYPRTKSPQKVVSDKQPSVRPKDSPRASPSPDRKHGYQPTNAKPDDSIYPRTKSPQKIVSDKQPSVRPKDSPRASPSPDRQHGYQAPSAKPDDSIYPRTKSPQKVVSDKQPSVRPKDSPRASPSPDRKHGSQTPGRRPSPSKDVSRSTSPSNPNYPDHTQKRPSVSPERRPGYQPPEGQTKCTDKTPQRESMSSDKIPGYMKPTAASQPTEKLKNPTKPADGTNFNSPTEVPDTRKPQDHIKISKVKEDHYKFINEETKLYEKTDKVDTKLSSKPVPDGSQPNEKSPSRVQSEKRNSICDGEFEVTNVVTTKRNDKDVIEDMTTHTLEPKEVPNRECLRDSSPNKYDTYDKKSPDDVKDYTPKDSDRPHPDKGSSPADIGIYNRKPQDDTKYRLPKDKDSSKPQPHKEYSPTKSVTPDIKGSQVEMKDRTLEDKGSSKNQPDRESSPTKYNTYNRKHRQDEVKGQTSKDKNSLKSHPDRESSPTKNATYDRKHAQDEFKERTPEDKKSGKKHDSPQREPSPTKYGKKVPYNKDSEDNSKPHNKRTSAIEEETTIITKESKETKYDSITCKDNITKKSPENSSTVSKKTPRENVSDVKSFTKDNKYKQTTDFLAKERSTDEINKNTTTKDHPRQLVTPSCSPTRKPKPETEPSTGQSSPTTSVSGFVYFGSPPREKTEVTDLDEYYTESRTIEIRKSHERPDTLDVHRPPSSTKVPCRSPSPEKGTASPKDSFPRKSSLKKPSEAYQPSPTEKPPSSFHVSPTDDEDFSHHKVVKKDRLETELQDDTCNPKPLLERRETYEDRCKKILGMTDIKENVTKQVTHKHETKTDVHSTSVSPCENSVPKTSSQLKKPVTEKNTRDVTDFITHEKENTVNTSHHQDVPNDGHPKYLRDCSPTKLQDIIALTKSVDNYDVQNNLRKSPEKKPERRLLEGKPTDKYTHPDKESEKTCESPVSKITKDTQPGLILDKRPTPGLSSQESFSPDIKHFPKEVSPTKTDINKATANNPKEQFSPRPSLSPERKPSYTKTTTVTSKYTESSVEDIREATTTTEENKYSSIKPIESSTHQSPKTDNDQPRSISPNKYVPKENASKRDISAAKQTPSNDIPDKGHGNKYHQTLSPDKSDIIPGYMKTTASVMSKYDTYERDNIQETTISNEEERLIKMEPSRKTPKSEEPRATDSSKQNRRPDNQSPERKPELQEPLSPTKDVELKSPKYKTLKEPSPSKSDKSSLVYTKTKDLSITKHDTSTTSDVNEITTFKTVRETHPKSPSESPTRINPQKDEPRNVSPSRAKNFKEGRPNITDKKQSSTPTDYFSTKSPTSRHPRESSPTSPPSKTPGYMKTTTAITAKCETPSPIEDFDKKTILTTTEKKHSSTRILESPTRQVDYTSHAKSNLSARDRLSPERKPAYRPDQDSSTKISGVREFEATSPTKTDKTSTYMKTTTYSTKHDTVDDTDKILSSQTFDKKRPRPSVSPIQHKDSTKSTPEYPRTTSPSRPGYTKDRDIHTRDSLSPEKKPEPRRLSLTNREDETQILEDAFPSKSSPTRKIPTNIKTTAITTMHATNVYSQDIEETITSKSFHKKHPSNDISPTIREQSKSTSEYPRITSPSRSKYPEDNYQKRNSLSPDRKPVNQSSSPIQIISTKIPIDKYPEDLSTRPEISPESMMTTTTITSKSDTVEEILNSKITEKKTRDSESPTRQNIEFPETGHHRTMSPSRPYSYPNEKSPDRNSISPERQPAYKDDTTKKPDNSCRTDRSPTKKDITMQVTNTIAKYDTTSMTEETILNKTVNKKQTTSQSPTRKSIEHPKSEPHYPKEYSPRQSEKKSPTRNSASPERKPTHERLKAPQDLSPSRKSEYKHPRNTSPTRPEKVPGYMKTTTSVTSKYDTSIETDNIEETVKTIRKTTEKAEEPSTRPKPTTAHPGPESLSRSKHYEKSHSRDSEAPVRKQRIEEPKNQSPINPSKTTDNVTSTKYTKTKHTDEEETVTSRTIENKHQSRPASSPTSKITKDTFSKPIPGQTRSMSPKKLNTKGSSLVNKPGLQQPSVTKESPMKKPAVEDKHPKTSSPSKPEKIKPGYTQQITPVTSQYDTTSEEDIEEYITTETVEECPSSKLINSPTRYVPKDPTEPEQLNKSEELRQLRTPSPIKKITRVTEDSTDFIASEREQEVLHRVQNSLRKLSPERKDRSPSPGKSPTKTTTSLHDLNIRKTIETQDLITNEITETTEKVTKVNTPHSKSKEEKPKESKVTSKSRTVSPIKKPGTHSPTKMDKSSESPTKSRSISPKKPFGERPHSPQVSKIGNAKPKEQTPIYMTRKPTPATITTTKIEKAITMDVKKAIGTAKQNITKTTVKATASKFMTSTTKAEPEPKRASTPKGIKDYAKKDTDAIVTRTTSDTTLKSKKTSPQRMKSKPEIQVNDLSTSKTPKSPKSGKEPQPKFPSKPKSATSLNTSTDEDDIIIDVQQSKSSRENSPDRICPTPVNFSDDLGIPRFPDQVSEPDDELRKRTYNTIHETESLVDDIVEICEDDELFVKRTNVKEISEHDESLLSVHDKVSKFTNKIGTVTKAKDTTATLRDTEIKSHSDFHDQNLKSDECLLSVSEKVNKFAKGPRDNRDSKSPSRRIVDEYDKHTIYQDDYTKLSVNDKAHLFVETAENIKSTKTKPAQRVERPDLSKVDESLKSDDCLLSVSDKVNKFVKSAEQFFTETQEVDEKDKKIKEQHDKIMRQIVGDYDDETTETTEYTEEVVTESIDRASRDSVDQGEVHPQLSTKTTTLSHPKGKEHNSLNLKTKDRAPPVKLTTLRSSEAVKKAKALFENIASTTQKTKETSKPTTKLIDIGIKKLPKTDTANTSHPIAEDFSSSATDLDTEVDNIPQDHKEPTSISTTNQTHDTKQRNSPSRLIAHTPEATRSRSPMRHTVETSTTKTVVIKHVSEPESDSPRRRPETDKTDKVPGYLRPTKTSQIKEEKVIEETEVSSRRGSGKFGVELRRTSVDRVTPTGERRRSVEHPCIEDIFDLDLLEQMLEKVTGYEQRRRIRAQIRVARKSDESNTFTKTTKTTLSVPKNTSTDTSKSPERSPKSPQKTLSPDRKSTPIKAVSQARENLVTNGHSKETVEKPHTQRQENPEKQVSKSTKSSSYQPNLEKKARPQSPTKTTTKPKSNRFNEYASAYMKKVGLNETSKPKTVETKKSDVHKTSKQIEEHTTVELQSTSKSITERTSSRDVIETVEMNGKRSLSPDKKQSPERKTSPERRIERSLSPELQRRKSDTTQTETTIKTVYDADKKILPKVIQEEKPSWVTNRNLKKTTSETRTLSSKKIEPEKPKYRAASPSKVISKPLDAITSSYGPGPLDSNGKPLFGIKALRKGSSNYQVKGTVIRQEFHSRNGSEPEGTVSVTAYSTEPEELEKLLQSQGAPPSRIHGLAAITTTRKFGGDTGTTIHQAHGKDERVVLEQFTHSDRRVSDFDLESQDDSFGRISETRRTTVEELDASEDVDDTLYREETPRGHRTDGYDHEPNDKVEIMGDKKTVRKSSVKSLTEKYIKSANESSKTDRTTYPKAGLILRTATMKDSISSDSSAHAGLMRTDSEHSLGSLDDTVVTTTSERVGDGVRTTTTTTTRHHERSFLDDNTKVTGVQDILTRMKNADIVIQDGDTSEDTEARALLNKFLGATVLMAGMQGYVTEKPSGKVVVKQETVRSSGGKVSSSSRTIEEIDLDHCWDERVLKKLLEECTDYEQRRRLRARIRTLMAEQEACASAVTEALAAAGEVENTESGETREEAEVTVTSSVRRDSSEKIVSSSTTTKTSKVIESMARPAPKPVSPFAKFRQLEKQNSTTSPNSPKTPQSPGSPSQPYFKFTDPTLQASALTIKERLLQWCRDKTRDYENVKLENFSTSWADGLAFCALLHHFLPDAFDYSQLTADKRRHNFTLAFKIADEKAGIYPLLDVEDMVTMRKPDWKCVFTYVQSIHRRFKDQD